MTPWIALTVIVAFYLLGPLFWGIRGAIICFVLPPASSLVVGTYYTLVHRGDLIARKLISSESWLATIGYLIAGSFGGPYLFVVVVWMIGFPCAAVGLWLHRRIKRPP